MISSERMVVGEMDGWGVVSNLLWMLGFSLLLAAWSLAYYEAQRTSDGALSILRRERYSWSVTLGLVLLCAGLAATVSRTWAKVLWGALGFAFLVDQVLRWRKTALPTPDEAETEC